MPRFFLVRYTLDLWARLALALTLIPLSLVESSVPARLTSPERGDELSGKSFVAPLSITIDPPTFLFLRDSIPYTGDWV